MYTVEAVKAHAGLDNNCVVEKHVAEKFFNELLSKVPYGVGINNQFFIDFLDPLKQPPKKASLHIMLQNWLEQKRILRGSLVQGLEASVITEYWQGQMAYIDLLQDEIQGCHVNLAWESLKQPAAIAGIDLPHSVDSQNSPLITDEMKALRAWQGEELRKDHLVLIAVAIFERQSQPVLRRTYQALNAWYGDQLTDEQRKQFDRYFVVHTSIRDVKTDTSFDDVVVNIPKNSGVEEKHAAITGDCFIKAKKEITVGDLKRAVEIFDLVNNKQCHAWTSVYNQCVSVN